MSNYQQLPLTQRARAPNKAHYCACEIPVGESITMQNVRLVHGSSRYCPIHGQTTYVR